MHDLQLLQQLFDIQLGTAALWQPLQLPTAVGVLLHIQLQTVELQVSDTRLACQQAAAHIRHQSYALQAQAVLFATQAHVMRLQHRGKALPTTFEATDTYRHTQLRRDTIFQFEPIFSHQRHQLTAQADVQRGQHQHGGAKTQAPAQQRRKQTRQGVHLDSPRAQSSTTSYCSWEYMVSTWNLMVRPMKASRSATLPDSSSSRRSTTF